MCVSGHSSTLHLKVQRMRRTRSTDQLLLRDYFTPKNCHKCNSVLECPVEYVINPDIAYEDTALEKYKISTPTEIELIMAGFRLPQDEPLIQSKSKYITFFQSWPLTTPTEVKIATCSGEVQISTSGFTSQSLKHHIANFESKHKLIGSGVTGGFPEMRYLSDVTRTSRTERHRQQEGLPAWLLGP